MNIRYSTWFCLHTNTNDKNNLMEGVKLIGTGPNTPNYRSSMKNTGVTALRFYYDSPLMSNRSLI